MSEPIEARVLPHDLSAERAVLGAILIRPDVWFDVAEQLRQSDFYRDPHRRIFAKMLELSEAKIAIDGVTLKDALARDNELESVGGPAYLFALTDGVPHSTNAVEYARIVRDKAQLRQLVSIGQRMISRAFDAGEHASAIVDATLAELLERASARTDRGFIDTKTLMPQIVEAVEQLVANPRRITGVASGFSDLDDMTRGFQPSDLIIIAARPAMGKTSLAMNIVQHAAIKDGRRVAVFSLEMGRKSLGLRLLSSEARIDHHKLLSGQVHDGDWSRISNAIGRLAEAGILIDDATSTTVFDVRAKARRLAADGGLDLIVIDYLQLMTATQKAENKNLEVAAITKGLKAIARDLEIPVVLLSQLSRDPEKRGNHLPQLSDLRDSGAIEQDADLVIFIHRAERYAATAENRGQAEAIIGKARNGPTGVVKLLFHDHLVRFDNLSRLTERKAYAGELV